MIDMTDVNKELGRESEPSGAQVRSSALLAECVEYTKAIVECGRVRTVPDLLANVSYVYLTWSERAALAWRILKTVFR